VNLPSLIEPRTPRRPGRPGRPGLVYWPAVAAAGTVALVLLTGLFVWVAVHPVAARTVDNSAPQAILQPAPEPPVVVEVTAVEPQTPESPPHKHTSVHRAASGHRTPAERAPEEPKKEAPFAPAPEELKKEAAPPPGPRAARPAGENYGTSVLFLSNPEEAARLAREENKLLFVLHVSGNFEDSCFT
jgi:hypothetical protein